MSTKHTEGPLYFDEDIRVRQQSTDAVVCTIEDGLHMDEDVQTISDEEMIANGYLFAAAPELLEALRAIKHELAALIPNPAAEHPDFRLACENSADRECLTKAYNIARTAIAKGEG